MGRRANNIASFLSKISMGKSCWFWIGTKATTGYGQFSLYDKTYEAHRTLWTRSSFISSVGAVTLETVKAYIEGQKI